MDVPDPERRGPTPSSCTACEPPSLGEHRQPQSARVRAIDSPCTRIALQPPPFDLIRSGQRTRDARAAAPARGCARSAPAPRRLRAEIQARQATTAAPPEAARRSHSQPAERGRELLEQISSRRRHRASVHQIPGEHAQRHHSQRTLPAPDAPPFPHRYRAQSRGADRAADRARRAQGRPAQLGRARQAQRRADLPAALDPHARVVRDRHLRARRSPDGAAPR